MSFCMTVPCNKVMHNILFRNKYFQLTKSQAVRWLLDRFQCRFFLHPSKKQLLLQFCVWIFFSPYSNQYVCKTAKTIYCMHWGCIVKYELLTIESITILTKKQPLKTEKNLSKSAAAQIKTYVGKRKHFPYCTRENPHLRKNSYSSTTHSSISAKAKIWSGKITTYTVLSTFYFPKVSQYQPIKAATALLLSLLYLPTPRHLLHKCLGTTILLYLNVFIDSAFKKSHSTS